MKISTKSQYGLRAMSYLTEKNEKGKVSSLNEIAEAENIPADYLEKIMGNLRESNLVESKKGAGGGYTLARKPKKISVKDIIDAVGEMEGLVECLKEGKRNCKYEKHCVVKVVWEKLEKSLYSTLESIKLSDLDHSNKN